MTIGRERPKSDFLHHGVGNLLLVGHAIRLDLKNAGATSQRAMTAIFHEMMHTYDYVDDIVVKSKTKSNHIEVPRLVFERLKKSKPTERF